MKQRHIFIGVLAASLLALALAMLFPAREHAPRREPQTLPWQIEPTADGSIRVFGLWLGKSTVGDAVNRFQEPPEVSLFESPDKARVVEVYFNSVTLAGLRARIVLSVDLDEQELAAIYARGVRISTLGDGSRKVSLHSDDLLRIEAAPIAGITYLPKAKLDEELLMARFGEPVRRIREKKNRTLHWLYPDLGLDIARDNDGRVVLQYLPPKQFGQRLLRPLLSAGKEEF